MTDGEQLILCQIVGPEKDSVQLTVLLNREAISAVAASLESKKESIPSLYVINLLSSVALGLAVLGWLAAYTERFTALQTLLGLGGIFVWFTFLANVIPDTKKAIFRDAIDRSLHAWQALVSILVVAVILGQFASHRAALVLVDRTGTAARFVSAREVLPNGALGAASTDDVLPANGTLRLTVPTGRGAKVYRVFASGLPAIDRDVHLLDRVSITVPTDFQKTPVALIHLSKSDTLNIDPVGTQLVVRLWRNNTVIGKATFVNYDGRSVWLGCDPSVPIPATVKERWDKSVAGLWGTTTSAAEQFVLRSSDGISARLERGSDCLAALPLRALRPVQYPEGMVAELTVPPCVGR